MGATETLLNIIGGVALLLWGTRMVRTGMTRAFGADLRKVVARGTANRLAAFAAGLGVTILLQSSMATALILVSFAGRGLIALTPALAVMLGADVGTTLVAQVLSLDVFWLSPLLILAGVLSFRSAEGGRPRHLGRVAIGVGLMLLALRLIVATSAPLRDSAALAQIIAPIADEPLLALLLAAALTWLTHSSLAVVLLIMSLAQVGIAPIGLALVLVLGANVGGALAPMTSLLGAPNEVRRVPLTNAAMRLVGALAALPLLPLVMPYLAMLEPEAGRMVVNLHTGFNLALALIFLPLISFLAAAATRLLPDTKAGEGEAEIHYLNDADLDEPTVALANAARETLRMGDVVTAMLADTIVVFRANDGGLAREVSRLDDRVDVKHEAIKFYLTEASRREMDEAEARRTVDVLSFTTNLEHVGDIIDKNLMELAEKKIANRLSFSPEGQAEIEAFHAQVAENLQLALSVFVSGDKTLARRLLGQKVVIRDLERQAVNAHLDRLKRGLPETLETSRIHLDVIRDLKRINSHLTSVAYPILEAAGELRESRLRHGEQTSSAPDEGSVPEKGGG